jgi:hypothetical protein
MAEFEEVVLSPPQPGTGPNLACPSGKSANFRELLIWRGSIRVLLAEPIHEPADQLTNYYDKEETVIVTTDA